MIYKGLISPILDRLDSETMHHFAVDMLHLAESNPITRSAISWLATGGPRFTHPALRSTQFGLEFENPLMVGAGWDKTAKAVRGAYELGFGGVEVGSVLEHPQPGNPKPRQYMLGDGVSIQWLGFNSAGMEAAAKNLETYRDLRFPIGVNIGKNLNVTEADAPRAYAAVAKRLGEYASYFVINVSSPNTPGLRKLQDRPLLTAIVQAVKETLLQNKTVRPCFVKIAPDMTNDAVDDVIDVALSEGIVGIVATNTSLNSDIKAKYGERWRNQAGGIGGNDADYRRITTEKVRHVYTQTRGRLVVIGIGGICDTASALEKLSAGASILQIVTGIRGKGPGVANDINRGLAAFCDQQGIRSILEIVGQDLGDVSGLRKSGTHFD